MSSRKQIWPKSPTMYLCFSCQVTIGTCLVCKSSSLIKSLFTYSFSALLASCFSCLCIFPANPKSEIVWVNTSHFWIVIGHYFGSSELNSISSPLFCIAKIASTSHSGTSYQSGLSDYLIWIASLFSIRTLTFPFYLAPILILTPTIKLGALSFNFSTIFIDFCRLSSTTGP